MAGPLPRLPARGRPASQGYQIRIFLDSGISSYASVRVTAKTFLTAKAFRRMTSINLPDYENRPKNTRWGYAGRGAQALTSPDQQPNSHTSARYDLAWVI